MPFWKKTLIFIGISFIALILFNSFIMPWYVRHDTLVQVPSVVGLQYDEAMNVLDEASLEGKQGDIRYDPSKPIGMIIEQIPPAGQVVKHKRRIYLIISGGEQLYEVPNLVGRSIREAKFSILQRNLDLIEVSQKQSAQYPSGIIVEQIEQPGTKLKKGTKVGVVVSVGMDAGNIKVPDLIGKNLEEAKKILVQYKLSIGKVTNQPSTSVPLNSVIDQYPRPNSLANENEKIDLFINKEVKKVIPKIETEFEGNVETPENKDQKFKEIPEDIEEIPDEPVNKEDKNKPPVNRKPFDKKPKDENPDDEDGTNY